MRIIKSKTEMRQACQGVTAQSVLHAIRRATGLGGIPAISELPNAGNRAPQCE